MTDYISQLPVQLYSKLAAALSVSGVVEQNPSSLLSIQIPGLYIRPNLKVDDPTTEYYVSNILNAVIAFDWRLVRRAGNLADIYKSILDGKEVPLYELDPSQKQKLEEAYEYLFNEYGEPSEAYNKYKDLQLNYLRALDNYEAAEATYKNGGPKVPNKLKKELNNSENMWIKEGNKAEVEDALNTIIEYDSLDPLVFWQRLSNKYDAYTRTVNEYQSTYQITTSIPSYKEWFQDFGWASFSFNNKDFLNQNRAGGIGMGGWNCCCEPTPPPIESKDLLDELKKIFDSSANQVDFDLTCELRRVEIIRPWLDINVFYSKAWRWSPASISYGVQISSGGDIAGGVAAQGVMPLIPTTAIIIRNLSIYWYDEELRSAIKDLLDKHKCVHFGPFNLSRGEFNEQGHLEFKELQVIGYISTILPKTPDPDGRLRWPDAEYKDDVWF